MYRAKSTENDIAENHIIDAQPLYGRVYSSIKKAILAGTFKPGEKLTDHGLSVYLGVSRTPVREAVKLLLREGLLEGVPNKGVTVFEPSPQDIAELYAIRSYLEGMAAHLAAKNPERHSFLANAFEAIQAGKEAISQGKPDLVSQSNTFFHDTITGAARCRHLEVALGPLRAKAIICRRYSMKEPYHRDISIREHEEILKAIVDGDPFESESLVRWHIQKAGQRLLVQVGLPQVEKDENLPIFKLFDELGNKRENSR